MTARQPLSVLFVEDMADDAELVVGEIRRSGFDVRWTRCDTYPALTAGLDEGLDVVLCDYSLPGMDPIEVLARIRAVAPELPVIVISGAVREDVAATLFKHGATDLLSKDRLARLGPAVKAALTARDLARLAREATERERLTYSLLLGLLEHAPAAICVRDGDGTPLVSNHVYRQLLAVGPADEGDRSVGSSGRDPGPAPGPPAREMRSESRREEVRLGGKTFLGLSFPIAVQGQDGSVGEILLDISQQKRIERELLRARTELQQQAGELRARNRELVEADRLKTGLVATVSHELRTPLTSILGYSELLTDAGVGEAGSPTRRMVETISRNSARLLTLIDNLLLLAKHDGLDVSAEDDREATVVEVAQLVDTVTSVIAPSVRSASLQLHTDVVQHPAVFSRDRDQLERALINLVSNAVKFSRPGGCVVIGARAEDGQVVIEVIDQGIGMAEDELAQIGTRFFRGATALEGQVQGTGLGVSVVRAIVESHGGSLTYRSSPREGTTARMCLPSAR